MSQAVKGERNWLDRDRRSVSDYHRSVPLLIAVPGGLGLLPLGWGIRKLQVWPTLLGLVLVMGGKLWYLDRMVWLSSDHARKICEAATRSKRMGRFAEIPLDNSSFIDA